VAPGHDLAAVVDRAGLGERDAEGRGDGVVQVEDGVVLPKDGAREAIGKEAVGGVPVVGRTAGLALDPDDLAGVVEDN
jgi:hypothetical protein